MSTAAELRTASHLLAQVSGLQRKAGPPTAKEWEHLEVLYPPEATFELSNKFLDWARKVEDREQAA